MYVATDYPSYRLARRSQLLKRSALQEMLVAASRPEILSFALGLPAADLFPVDAYREAVATVLGDPRALQYGPPSEPLKRHIVQLMARRGVHCRAEQILLINGAQQGLALLAQLLLDDGGQVMLEELSYPGFQQVINLFRPAVVTVPTDPASGIDVEGVAACLARSRPAFLYAISSGHNPLGVSLTAEQQCELVALARHYRTPIVEDDAYGFIYYQDRPVPALRALDEEMVFYIGSFSKILAPALRTGWIIAPERFIPKLEIIKEASDIGTASLAQRTIAAVLDTGILPDHIAHLRRQYQARRDAMIQALEECFPLEAEWHTPDSGFFIWITLPEWVHSGELLARAIHEEQVAFVPGHAFCSQGGIHGTNCLRLNFSHCSIAQIEEGIARLGRLLKQQLVPTQMATVR
jgi:2-aminoadipate transaminase